MRTGRADSPTAAIATAVLGAALGYGLGGPVAAIAGLAVGAALPRVLGGRRERRRREATEEQLAEAIAAMGAALRSGMSLMQAIRFAAEEGSPPVSLALARVAEHEAVGVPLDEALRDWARTDGGADVRLAAGILMLYHRVGGEVPSVLDHAVRALRQRHAAERELRSLTAQARLSGAVLGLLPVGFFLFLAFVARADVEAALHTPAGVIAITLGLALDGAAFLWIRKLLRVAI